MKMRFDRHELAGSLGDLGVLLPMAIGMILVNRLHPMGVFLAVGLYYIAAGLYFRTTTPVQPMKVIGSYAIAMGLSAQVVWSAGLTVGILLLAIGASGLMTRLGRLIPRPAIRGIQLSTGTLLMAQGVRFILGNASFQTQHGGAEPFLAVQSLGPLPIGWLLGLVALILTLFLLTDRRLPGGLAVVIFGLAVGLALGAPVRGLDFGLHLPGLLPAGLPAWADLVTAMLVLTLPQLPMTLGNAVLANADLAREYFGEDAARSTSKALCISMGLANLGSYLLGGMPMCHGAGGLAAHYRFGARTAGSNLMIGAIFVLGAIILGDTVLQAAELLPLSVLGVLLVFAGAQLSMTIGELQDSKSLFVALTVLGVTMASNLAVGFVVGTGLHYLLRWERLSI